MSSLQGNAINAFLCSGRGTNFLSTSEPDPSASNKTNENTLPIEMDASKISDNTTYKCKEVTSKFAQCHPITALHFRDCTLTSKVFTAHSHCPISIQIKCPIPIILLSIPMNTHIRIGSRIGIRSVSVKRSFS